MRAGCAGVPRQRLEFTYDSQSRRIRKLLKEWDAAQATFVLKRDTHFLYDGWNVIAEFESSTGVPLALKATYAWGLDLSGTTTGAGGVGGLLFAKLHATPGTPILAPCYDGNGNILAYLDCATGQTLARYEYDPFGRLLLKEEDTRVAGRLHHQFSTKYTDDESGLSYYGYRYYAPELGRWVSRDPIGERGGVNSYGMVRNNPVVWVDGLGFEPYSSQCGCDGPKLEEGMGELQKQTAQIKSQLESGQIDTNADPSCFSWHTHLLAYLEVPPCWECRREARSIVPLDENGDPGWGYILTALFNPDFYKVAANGFYYDHVVVICHGRGDDGQVRFEIILDITGGYTNPDAWRDYFPNAMPDDYSPWKTGEGGGPPP